MVQAKKVAVYINKQFEMINVPFRYSDIPDSGKIEINKKKIYWYEYYKFKSIEQWQQWRDWMKEQMEKIGTPNIENLINEIDLLYGIPYEIPIEKGQTKLAF